MAIDRCNSDRSLDVEDYVRQVDRLALELFAEVPRNAGEMQRLGFLGQKTRSV